MTTLVSRLKSEAIDSCLFRGHKMSKFHRVANITGRVIWRSYCEICNNCVTVIPEPRPNEINISGLAVAVNCEG